MLFKKKKHPLEMENKDINGILENEDLIADPSQPGVDHVAALRAADLKEITRLNQENEALGNQTTELKDKYLRLMAEFENYKKRSLREKVDYLATAGRDTMSGLLPVLDDFDRASRNETFSEGVSLVYQKFQQALKQKGLQVMESTGKEFDPELHEAITEIPTPDEKMKGKIMDTVERGYFMNDKLIRHAKVVVGK